MRRVLVKRASALATAIGAAAASAEVLDAPPGSPPTQRTTAHLSSLAASARSDRHAAALFAAGYDTAGRTGSVTGYALRPGSPTADARGLWGELPATAATDAEPARPARPRSTASLMDAHGDDWPAARVVLSARSTGRGAPAVGIPWEWASLSQPQQSALMDPEDGASDPAAAEANAKDRLAYLRGDRGKEQGSDPGGPLRRRSSRHGEIVNSRLWHQPAPAAAYSAEDHAGFRRALAARPPMLYVGAGDGMLHGFDASTGEERIAYVPEGLHARLARLTHPAWRPAPLVDGSPLVGDLYLGAPGTRDPGGWRSYLAGFLGAGGRGYFVLDVTDPAAFARTRAERVVVLDRSAPASLDDDIGEIMGEPATEAGDASISRQITPMNDGRWALVIGNGERSASGAAVLLVQYLDRNRELLGISAAPGPGNGLGVPRLVDLDGNGTADVAYAGDLLGNLWKFDLRAATAGSWKTAFDGAPMFVARDASAAAIRQPITAAPVWKAHPQGGLIVAFGTGRRNAPADGPGLQGQTIYGIHDDTPILRHGTAGQGGEPAPRFGAGRGPVANGRTGLVAQSVQLDGAHGAGTVSSQPVPYAGSEARRGWFLDLPLPGERVLQNPGWFEGDLIDVWSQVPAPGSSLDLPPTPARRFRTTLDILNGSAPRSTLYAHLPAAIGGQPSRLETGLGIGIRGDRLETSISAPGQAVAPPMQRLGSILLRPGWRQLQ
ncbi:pilus assembly protein [Variovorax saccharolyticus]|uniref:pilus assembly protein n=1 Tax=Variovorax saccharolyticus TaxID=3053516 RepID=UPI0025766974|nr:PilC/PilY family type IV pilus protein [Variovorax sp. J31P216]MDM0023306.1 PilC/PilY family type IV pilus protein [Variovorax sp. J31P216]